MKKILTSFFLIITCAITVYSQKNASIIIINAKITTLDELNMHADAVVITGNKITYVGIQKEALAYSGTKTVLIDAKGKTVIPGLFDSHQHVIRGGRFYNTELRWDGVSTLKQALTMLKDQAARTPKGQWVRVVGGWNEFQFAEKRLPTMKEINEATGNTPAFILYLYGKAWLNKSGIRELKINAGTPNPPAGLIEKDAFGEPTGLLIAEPNAFILYSTLAKLPELSFDEKMNSTQQYMRELNSLGVTGVMDAGGGFQNYPDDYLITDSLNRLGKLTLRIPFYLFAQKKGTELTDYLKWSNLVNIEQRQSNGLNDIDYHVEGGGENLVADAADFENFLLPRPELPATMESSLKSILELLVKKRWPFRIHATYNESITRDLTIIEEVNRTTPLNGLIWFIDHAETISDENIQRIKNMGGGIAIQDRMAFQGELFIRRYGKKAAESSPPIRKILSADIPVGLGTDGTRVSSYNPWIALYWIVSGKTIGATQVLSDENKVDRITALKLFTTGGYRLIKEDATKGRIRAGYSADLVILDQDYFTAKENQIASIRSTLTIVDGKIVYGSADYNTLAPKSIPVLPAWSPVKYYSNNH